jgi:hypothetical protein
MRFSLQDNYFEMHPIAQDKLAEVLDVCRQCEDFLALGPAPTASMEMVLNDIEHSQKEGGAFCGIYDAANGRMIGIVDCVPGNFEGKPQAAFLSLLMIAPP